MPKLFRFAPIGALLSLLLLVTAHSSSAATITVTNTNDSGEGSLRQALIDANSSPDNDTIDFDIVPSCSPCTITLTTGQLSIDNNGSLTINGPGADRLTISGGGLSRVIFIRFGAHATINGLTISGGFAPGGGGILTNGTVTMNNLIVRGNSAVVDNESRNGGGIFSGGILT